MHWVIIFRRNIVISERTPTHNFKISLLFKHSRQKTCLGSCFEYDLHMMHENIESAKQQAHCKSTKIVTPERASSHNYKMYFLTHRENHLFEKKMF